MFQGGRRLGAGKRLFPRPPLQPSLGASVAQSTWSWGLEMNTQDDLETHLPKAQAWNCSLGEPLQTTTPRCPQFTADAPTPARSVPDAILHATGTCLLPVRATSYLLGPVWGGAEKVVEFRKHCELE